MDIQNKISCVVMHPKLFPAYFLDPFNPQRMKAIVEVDTDKLSFLSLPSNRKSRLLGNVSLNNIQNVTVQNLSTKAQRFEILKKSLVRYLFLSVVIALYTFLFQSVPLFASFMITLTIAPIMFPFIFLLNGGFAIKKEVARFLFTPVDMEKTFYIEVESRHETELQESLHCAGLRFVEDEKSQEIWTCDECGAVVEASAVKCPNCGANFED